MRHQLLSDTFHFEKRAGKTVRGGRADWEKAVLDILSDQHPFVLENGPQFEFEWDSMDPEVGMGSGKLVVWNREPLPAATTMQMAELERQNVQDPGKSVAIPIFVKDFEIQDLDTFVSDGLASRLSEKRWAEFMGSVGEMGVIDPNIDPKQLRGGAPTHNLPFGAAGWDRSGVQGIGSMEKVSKSMQLPILGEALEEIDPYDQQRIRDLVTKEAVVAGLGARGLVPVVRVMITTPPTSLADIEERAYDQLPPNVVYVQEIRGAPYSTRSGTYRATIVSDRYFHPSIVEGDYAMICQSLRGIVPDIDVRMRTPGNFVVDLDGRQEVAPVVIEDLSVGAEGVRSSGSWLCLDLSGEFRRFDAYMNVMGFDGSVTGHKLFVGDGCWAMSTDVAGKRVAGVGEIAGDCCVRSGLDIKYGDWVSIFCGDPSAPDCEVMIPGKVAYVGPCHGSGHPSHMRLETLFGEDIEVRFGPVLRIVAVSGSKWPDLAMGAGGAKYLVPATSRVVKLGGNTSLESSPVTFEKLISSYIRAGGAAETAGRAFRFSPGTDAEALGTVMLQCNGPDDFSIGGQMLKGVVRDDIVHGATTTDVTYILCVLGCSRSQALNLIERSERGGGSRIHIAGLRPISSTADADGTRKVPFFRKAAALSVQLRGSVSDTDRDALFLACSCIPFKSMQQKVAAFLQDEAVQRRMEFFGSKLPLVARGGLGDKLAANFADPQSIDVMLGVGILNERNVRGFLSKLADMRQVEDTLAELSMMSKLGLSGVEVSDVTEALDSLGRVNESLEQLQAQLTSSRVELA